MKPPPRTEARSPALLPWTSSVVAVTSPTKPVNRLMTVTSRFPRSVGCSWAGAASPAGARAAARACPTSQMPLTSRTAPTYSSITPSSMGDSFLPRVLRSWPWQAPERRRERDHGGAPPAPGRRQRRDDLRLRAALLGVVDRRHERARRAPEQRRGEDPPRLAAAHRARGGRGLGAERPDQLERPVVLAAVLVDRHR